MAIPPTTRAYMTQLCERDATTFGDDMYRLTSKYQLLQGCHLHRSHYIHRPSDRQLRMAMNLRSRIS